jgi:mycoredoxin
MGTVELYTRPGCPWSARLRWQLRRRGIAYQEINIWEDEAARARVRAVADGSETVPTVHVSGRWLVNPKVAEVAAACAGSASG